MIKFDGKCLCIFHLYVCIFNMVFSFIYHTIFDCCKWSCEWEEGLQFDGYNVVALIKRHDVIYCIIFDICYMCTHSSRIPVRA